ncbi:hypothetical protein JKG68_10665 [Microvirga aerilata]|uniref:Uncharacterized protein n=1 Tax=Microvirga aerilata TaxID=670292 RepID=A0A937CZ91_9HYPH|nr:hypothetical protein [Microvirga aerilata]MBL0404431.1 hypothetical protein [Microvirga aerilata]
MFKRVTLDRSQQPSGTYLPEIPLLLQPRLKALAKVDIEFQKDREIILKSTFDEPLKQRAIATLAKRHQERRAPYLRGIGKLERHIQKKAA